MGYTAQDDEFDADAVAKSLLDSVASPDTPKAAPTNRKSLSQGELEDTLRQAGWAEKYVPKMAAIGMAESSRTPDGRAIVNSFNPGVGHGGVATNEKSYGNWQINMVDPARQRKYDKTRLATDPVYNARVAKDLFDERQASGRDGFTHWGAYTDGNYKKFYNGQAARQPAFDADSVAQSLLDAIDLPGAKPSPTIQGQPMAPSSTAGIAPPTAPVPELPQTLEAQRTAALDPNSTRIATLYTDPTTAPEANEHEFDVQITNGQILRTNPVKLLHYLTQTGQTLEDIKSGKADFTPLIGGKASPTGEPYGTQGQVAVVTMDENGTELVSSTVANPQDVPKQAALDALQFPGRKLQTKVVPAADVIAMRQPAENPAPTSADYDQYVASLKPDDPRMSINEFNQAVAANPGTVDTTTKTDDVEVQKALAAQQQQQMEMASGPQPMKDGGQIEFPLAVGQQGKEGDIGDSTAAVYDAPDGMSYKDAQKAAFMNAAAKYGDTGAGWDKVAAQMYDPAAEKAWNATKGTGRVEVTYNTLESAGIDAKNQHAMMQAQNVGRPEVDTRAPAELPTLDDEIAPVKDYVSKKADDWISYASGEKDWNGNDIPEDAASKAYRKDTGDEETNSSIGDFLKTVVLARSPYGSDATSGIKHAVVQGVGEAVAKTSQFASGLMGGLENSNSKWLMPTIGLTLTMSNAISKKIYGADNADVLGSFGNRVEHIADLSTPDGQVYKYTGAAGKFVGGAVPYIITGLATGGNPIATMGLTNLLTAKGKGESTTTAFKEGLEGGVAGFFLGGLGRFGRAVADEMFGEAAPKAIPWSAIGNDLPPTGEPDDIAARAITKVWGILGHSESEGGDQTAEAVLKPVLEKTGLTLEQIKAARIEGTSAEKNLAAKALLKDLSGDTKPLMSLEQAQSLDTVANNMLGNQVVRRLVEKGVPVGLAFGLGSGMVKAQGGSNEDALQQGLLFAAMETVGGILHKKDGEKLTPIEIDQVNGAGIRVPGPDGKPHDLLLLKNENGDGVTVTDVTGVMPPEFVQTTMLPKPPDALVKAAEDQTVTDKDGAVYKVVNDRGPGKPLIVQDAKGVQKMLPERKIEAESLAAIRAEKKPEQTKDITDSEKPVTSEIASVKLDTETEKNTEISAPKPQPLSNTQVEFSKEQAKPFEDFRNTVIDPKDVADKSVLPEYAKDGIHQIEPHITVKYGLHTNDHEDVMPTLKGEKPVEIELGKTSVFKGSEKKIPGTDKPVPYDVVTVKVKSSDLKRLNKKLTEGSENTTTFPYDPHVTLAYVKAGEGEKYAGRTDFEGQKYTFNGVTFSPADKSGKKLIPLDTQKESLPQPTTKPPPFADFVTAKMDGKDWYIGQKAVKTEEAKGRIRINRGDFAKYKQEFIDKYPEEAKNYFGKSVKPAKGKALSEKPLKMVAWHGSPHTFDKFDSSKIGTGEGAQAYGHGLYFTDKEAVADHYKDKLSPSGTTWRKKEIATKEAMIRNREEWIAGHERRIKNIDERGSYATSDKLAKQESLAAIGQHKAEISLLQRQIDNFRKEMGAKYRVDLKAAADEYLLWDKPLSEQSERTKQSFEGFLSDLRERMPASARPMLDKAIAEDEVAGWFYKFASNYDINVGQKETSEDLRKYGIRGIKYLDGSSRGKGEGSHNYVIFDHNDVSIEEVLKKVRTAESTQKRRELEAEPDFHKVLNEVSGGELLPDGTYHLNEADAEAVRRLMSQMADNANEKPFDALTWNESFIRKLAAYGRDAVRPVLVKDGIGTDALENFDSLTDMLDHAADTLQGHSIAFVYEDSLKHERTHLEEKNAGGPTPETYPKLKANPIWATSGTKFDKAYPGLSDANKASELAAILANNEAGNYGLDDIEGFEDYKKQFLDTWANGVVDNNIAEIMRLGADEWAQQFPIISGLAFEGWKDRNAPKETEIDAKTHQNNETTDVSGRAPPAANPDTGEGGKTADAGTAPDTAAEDHDASQDNVDSGRISGDSERELTEDETIAELTGRTVADVEQGNRKFARTLADNLMDIGDVPYDKQTEKGWREGADKIIAEKGIDGAVEEYRKMSGGDNEGRKTALGVQIAVEMYADGRQGDLMEFGRELTANIGNNAQELRAAALMARLSPPFAQITGDKIVQKAKGRGLTPEEQAKTDDLAKKLEEVADAHAFSQAALAEASDLNAKLEQHVKDLDAALKKEQARSTGKEASLQEALDKTNAAIAEYEKRLQGAAFQVKGPKALKELRTKIENNRPNLVSLLQSKFPGTPLKSVAAAESNIDTVLKSVAPDDLSVDQDTLDALVQMGAAKLIDELPKGLTPAGFDKWLKSITNDSLGAREMTTIHALAYEMTRPEGTHLSTEAKILLKNRLAHAKRAEATLINEGLTDITPEGIAEFKERRESARAEAKAKVKAGEAYRDDKFAQKILEVAEGTDARPADVMMAFGLRETPNPRTLREIYDRAFPEQDLQEWLDANPGKTKDDYKAEMKGRPSFTDALNGGKKLLDLTKDTLTQEKWEAKAGADATAKEVNDLKTGILTQKTEERLARKALEQHFQGLAQGVTGKALHLASALWNLPRSIMFGGDFGFIGAQGQPLMLMYPGAWARAIASGVPPAMEMAGLNKALRYVGFLGKGEGVSRYVRAIPGIGAIMRKLGMDGKNFEDAITEFYNSETRKRLETGGTKFERIGNIADFNDDFMSDIAMHIPWVAQTNKAHSLTTDLFRYYGGERILSELDKMHEDGKISAFDYNRSKEFFTKKFVNVMSGKGYLGKLDPLAMPLAQIMSAPRYALSAFQLPYYANPIRAAFLPKGARKIMMKNSLKLWGAAILGFGLLSYLGVINDDPEDKDFLQIDMDRVLGHHPGLAKYLTGTEDLKVNPIRSLKEPLRLGMGLPLKALYYGVTGNKEGLSRIGKEYYSSFVMDPFGSLGSFWKAKAHPSISMAYQGYTGKNYVGEPLQWTDIAPMPLPVKEVYQAWTYDHKQNVLKTGADSGTIDANWNRVLFTVFASMVGYGANSYAGSDSTTTQKELVSLMGHDDRPADQKAQSQKANQLERLIREGVDVSEDIKAAVVTGQITAKQSEALARTLADDLGDVQERFGVTMTDAEKATVMNNRRALKVLDYIWGQNFKVDWRKIDAGLKFATSQENWLNDRAAEAEAEAVVLQVVMRSSRLTGTGTTTDDVVDLYKAHEDRMTDEEKTRLKDVLEKKTRAANKGGNLTPDELANVKTVLPDIGIDAPKPHKPKKQ